MTYENVSGSFETPSCFRNVCKVHELSWVRKVVTRSLTRFLLGNVTWRHTGTKMHTVIWTCVSTQETKRDLRRNTSFRTRLTTSARASHGWQGHSGLGRTWNMKVCVVVYKSRLWEHILLFNSWPSHCPSCPSSPPPFLHVTFRVQGTCSNWKVFFPFSCKLMKENQVKLLKMDFQKKGKRTHFSGVRPGYQSTVLL